MGAPRLSMTAIPNGCHHNTRAPVLSSSASMAARITWPGRVAAATASRLRNRNGRKNRSATGVVAVNRVSGTLPISMAPEATAPGTSLSL